MNVHSFLRILRRGTPCPTYRCKPNLSSSGRVCVNHDSVQNTSFDVNSGTPLQRDRSAGKLTARGNFTSNALNRLAAPSNHYRKVVDVLTASFEPDKSLQAIGSRVANVSLALSTFFTTVLLRIDYLRNALKSPLSNAQAKLVGLQVVKSDLGGNAQHKPLSCTEVIYKYPTVWHMKLASGQTVKLWLNTDEPLPKLGPQASTQALSKANGAEDSSAIRSPTLTVQQNIADTAQSLPYRTYEEPIVKLTYLAFEEAASDPHCNRVESNRVKLYMNDRNRTYFGSQCSRSEYQKTKTAIKSTMKAHSRGLYRAYVALGSNLGDRIRMIESACHEMHQQGIRVIRTSALYETKPMYVEEQDPFVNGVCEVETDMAPLPLLDKLQRIETQLGRRKTIEKGPRNIDLDILLFNDEPYEYDRLSIPHKLMLEREFVLRPICDLIPNGTLPSPLTSPTFQRSLETLPKAVSTLSPLTPLSSSLPHITSLIPTRPTHLMAILNLTPDSFSDGGVHDHKPATLLPTVQSLFAAGATILDIGGQSTRPHALQVSASDELSRVLPAIRSIRSDLSFNKLAISVDTYRASVASAAVEAGANIVNDVSAGVMDPEMLPMVAKLGCTIILMHMRGTPETMNTLTEYPDGVITGVATELLARVHAAEAAGIFRWRIMLDPGIGFAKTQAQSLELLRRLDELRDWEGLRGLPWCVGTSRKRFIGNITGVKEARDRVWGTAGAVAAAVKGGADVVRVHDVGEMAAVVKMADAIWRIEDGRQR